MAPHRIDAEYDGLKIKIAIGLSSYEITVQKELHTDWRLKTEVALLPIVWVLLKAERMTLSLSSCLKTRQITPTLPSRV